MSFVPINPRPFLQGLIGQYIYVRLKWGETEYKGKFVSTDSYMNIQLSDAEEHIPHEDPTKLGQILIRYGSRPLFPLLLIDLMLTVRPRCNNVLWIRGAKDEDGNQEDEKDVAMAG
jgi:small nuclear ribonucleoprotein F